MTRYEMLRRSYWEAKSASLSGCRECTAFAGALVEGFLGYLEAPPECVRFVDGDTPERRTRSLSEAMRWGEDREYRVGVELAIDDDGTAGAGEAVVVEFGISRCPGGFLVRLAPGHEGLFASPAIPETMRDLYAAVFALVNEYYRKGLRRFVEIEAGERQLSR